MKHVSFRGSQGPQSISTALYPQFSWGALSSINCSISLKSCSNLVMLIPFSLLATQTNAVVKRVGLRTGL